MQLCKFNLTVTVEKTPGNLTHERYKDLVTFVTAKVNTFVAGLNDMDEIHVALEQE